MHLPNACIALVALVIAGAGGLSGCVSSMPQPTVSTVPEQNLMGVEWTAVAIDGAVPVVAPRPTLRWTGPQQIVGSGGCNNFRGRAVLESDSLRIGPVGGVGNACITAAGGQEDMFFKAIENTAKARMQDGQLVLLDAQGKVLVRLESAKTQVK